jgi:PAS domain S-box-containing protein
LREDAIGSSYRDESAFQKQSEQLASQRRPPPRTAASQSVPRPHSFLHSYGADFSATFQPSASMSSIPRTPTTTRRGHFRSGSAPAIGLYEMPPPSERLLRTIIDSIPVQIFTAAPQSGAVTWVNSRFLTYRGQTVEDFMRAPWQSIHDDDREEYMRLWSQALRNGEQFSHQVRIRRFDGNYRWFYVRAAPLRNSRGLTVHWFGTYMDIHEQHLAEIDLARQNETAASEAKYRALANSSPQIVFAATEEEGITFVNTQWLTYSGQTFKDALALGFMEHVHPDDLSKCKLPFLHELFAIPKEQASAPVDNNQSQTDSLGPSATLPTANTERTIEQDQPNLKRAGSNDSSVSIPELSRLANTGVIKVSRDNEGNPTYSTEVRLRSKDGEYRWHLVRCIIVDSKTFGDGECLWFGTCTDINDHKLLEKKLKETMDSKTRFLSNMSHEIRTPLIGISGMVKFLLDTPLSPEQLDYCHTISTSSEGLLLVINDILDLSKVDAGMMKLSYEWFHIRSLIEDANELLSTMAIQKRLELSYIVEENVPSVVKGDRVRLRQVLLNIIGNAIKFTSTGEVFSRCQIHHGEAVDNGEVMLSFEVTDTGPGFSEKEAELIFKPFSQIDGSSTRQHGGSGLGLVISRQLVELHGGKLRGTSTKGKGSTFLFTAKFLLPNEQESHISPTAESNKEMPASPNGNTRLFIDRESISPIHIKPLTQSPLSFTQNIERGEYSPVPTSSGSSDPSVRSYRTHKSERSSASSIVPSAIAFAKDIPAINLALPPAGALKASRMSSSDSSTLKSSGPSSTPPRDSRLLHPPLYSILVLSEQPHSREATARHIATTLPKDIPHQITCRGSLAECQKIIGKEDPVIFTHIVISLSDANEIIALVHQIFQSAAYALTSIVILSDPIQRTEILQLAPEYDFDQLDKDKRIQFIYKPIKPSRFAATFDPELERDLSTDRNRSSAQRVAESQKQVFVDMEKNVGNKGHRVLLVEDNPVNQKVRSLLVPSYQGTQGLTFMAFRSC